MDDYSRELIDALARHFSDVVAAILDVTPNTAWTARAIQPQWVVQLQLASATAAGRVALGFERQGAAELTRRVIGLEDQAPDAAISDTLHELVAQAAGAVSQGLAAGTKLTVEGIEATAPEAPGQNALSFDIVLPDFAIGVIGWSHVEVMAEPAARPQAADKAAASAPTNLDVILDIDLPLTVQFGQTEMPLQSLIRLGPGSVIDLNRSPDDPIEVRVNGRTIARGEVVVVSGNYGVRITEVISTAERIRTMGG